MKINNALLITEDIIEFNKISKILENEIKTIQYSSFGDNTLVMLPKDGFDLIIVHTHAELLLNNPMFFIEMNVVDFVPPVIVLLPQNDSKFIKDVQNLPEVDFCLLDNFSNDIMIELFIDTVHSAVEIDRRRKEVEKNKLSSSKDKVIPNNLNILVVDDDPLLVKILSRVLQNIGINNIFSVHNGFEAIATALRENIDLIFLDITMPEMDGILTLKMLKTLAHTKHSDVVIITGDTSIDTFRETIKLGAVNYITKPFSKEVILEKLLKIYPGLVYN